MRITIELTDRVSRRLQHEAEEIGVSPEVIVQVLVGRRLSHEAEGTREWMLDLARNSELTCRQCTQQLTPHDVFTGSCSRCEAPVGD